METGNTTDALTKIERRTARDLSVGDTLDLSEVGQSTIVEIETSRSGRTINVRCHNWVRRTFRASQWVRTVVAI